MARVNFALSLLAVVLFAGSAAGQTIPRPSSTPASSEGSLVTQVGSIRGRVVLEGGTFIAQAVRITLLNFRGPQATLYSNNQGQFEIADLSPGEYTLEAEGDRLRFEVSTEQVEVRRGSPTVVTIALKEKSTRSATKPAGTVASVGELSKDVPAKAQKEFERASGSAKEGKAAEAIQHLRKAIEIYPNFMMAHNDLGAQLLEQGRLEEAAVELQRALQLDKKAFNPNLNMGVLFVRQQRFAEAAEILRTALSLDSNSPAARLYLGIALRGLDDFSGAERELRAAYEVGGSSYAEALYYLGDVYMSRGERMLARQAFEAYLRDVPNAANAAHARQLISILR